MKSIQPKAQELMSELKQLWEMKGIITSLTSNGVCYMKNTEEKLSELIAQKAVSLEDHYKTLAEGA